MTQSVSVSTTSTYLGQWVTLTIVNDASLTTDWVGLFMVSDVLADIPNGRTEVKIYLNGGENPPASAISSATFEYPSYLIGPAGNYHFRMVRGSFASATVIATSATITVAVPPGVSLELDPPDLQPVPGGNVVAHVTYENGVPEDMVGFWLASETDIQAWTAVQILWMNNQSATETFPPLLPIASPSLLFSIPGTVGAEYVFRILFGKSYSGGPPTVLATSGVVTATEPVDPVITLTPDDVSVNEFDTITLSFVNEETYLPAGDAFVIRATPSWWTPTSGPFYKDKYLNGNVVGEGSPPDPSPVTGSVTYEVLPPGTPYMPADLNFRLEQQISGWILAETGLIEVYAPLRTMTFPSNDVWTGDTVVVTVSVPDAAINDQIAFYSETTETIISTRYLNGSATTPPSSPITDVDISYVMPVPANYGANEFFVFVLYRGALALVTSDYLQVNLDVTRTVTTSSSNVYSGATKTVSFEDSDATVNDRIVFNVYDYPEAVVFQYLNGSTTTPPTTPITVGALTFVIPVFPTDYVTAEFVLYREEFPIGWSTSFYIRKPAVPPLADLLTGLISYWPLDEASGNALDVHGINTLTNIGGVGSAPGKIGNARDFEISSLQRFEGFTNSTLETGDIDFTFSAWIKFESITGGYRGVFGKWDNIGVGEYTLFIQDSIFYFMIGYPSGAISVPSNATPSGVKVGVWYHVICWHDSVNNQLGIVVNNSSPDYTAHSAGVKIWSPIPFRIGSVVQDTGEMDGLIDEVGFWKRMLTPGERNLLYNAGIGWAYSEFTESPPFVPLGLLTSLVSYWKLDEASGIALDAHGTNDLTAVNGPDSAPGRINTARDFEVDLEQYLLRSSNPNLETGNIDFTFSLWAKFKSLEDGRFLIGKADEFGSIEYSLIANSDNFGFFVGYFGSTVDVLTIDTPSGIQLDVWYHVVCWHDSVNNEIGIVFNDDLATLNTLPHSGGVTVLSVPFVLGSLVPVFGSTGYMDGQIDEVGFWKRVLTPEERTSLYNSGLGLAYSEFTGGVVDLLSDLVAYWPMDEASGDVLDAHGVNHLAQFGAVGTLGSDAGKINTARDFPIGGTVDVRRISGSDLSTGDTDFTFSVWVRATAFPGAPTIFTRSTDPTGYGTDIDLLVYGGYLEFWINDSSGPFVGVPDVLEVGVWYHIVVWHDSVNNQIGMVVNNGVPATEVHSGGLVEDPTIPFIVGQTGYDDIDTRWNGQIDELGFWKRVLTFDERVALYNDGNGLAYPFGATPSSPNTISDEVTVSDGHEIFVLTGGSLVPARISRSDTVAVSDPSYVYRTAEPITISAFETVPVVEETKVFALKGNTRGIWVYDRVSAPDFATITPNYTLPLLVCLSGGVGNADPTQSLGGAVSSSLVLSQQFSQTAIPGLTILHAGANAAGQGRLFCFTAAEQAANGFPRRPVLWWRDPGQTLYYRETPITGDGIYSVEGYDYGMVLVKVVVANLDTVNSLSQPIDISPVSNQLFDTLTSKQAVEGHTDYRCIYLVNSLPEGGQEIHDIWISSVAGAFTKVLVGGVEFARGDGITTEVAPVIPDDTTAPPGVIFYDAPAGSLYVPTDPIAPGQAVAVWLQRIVPPNSGLTVNDTLMMSMEVTYNGARLSYYFTDYQYTLKDHLAQPWDFEYPFQIVAPFELDAPLFTQKVRTGLDIVYGFGNRAATAFVIDANLLQRVAQGWDFYYLFTVTARREFVLVGSMRSRAVRAFEIAGEIRSTQKSRRAWELVCGLFSVSAITTVTQPIVTIKGQSFPVEQAEVRLDEGQYAWACTLTLYDPVYYDLFQPGDVFSIDMLGEVYIFLYDGKSFSRNSIVDIAASVSGISPSAVLGEPRSKKITKTWNTSVLALQAVQEVIAGYPLVWEILNWGLPAYRLAVEEMTPIEIVQLIAAAAGGIVQTDPDGTLRVRYLFPIRVPDYPTAVQDQFYSDLDHNFTINEEVALPEIVNKIRIMDIAPGAFQDRVEFVQDEDYPDRGYLKVFPQPWRETLWVEHTSLPSVSAIYVGVVTEQLEPEDVEILDSKGSVSHPIYQLNTLEWLYLDLGGIVFESDKPQFTTTSTTHHESLLRITYTTRYLRFNVVAPGIEKVQFLVKEEEVV